MKNQRKRHLSMVDVSVLNVKRELKRAKGSITRAAEYLQISRQTLTLWIHDFDLDDFVCMLRENRRHGVDPDDE
jgi:transcriptional regulator with PAS, ATPase and Fis domain